MRKVRVSFVVLAVVYVFLATGLAHATFDKCALCGMNLAGNENTAYEIVDFEGKAATYCCAHCGLWVNAQEKGKITAARSRDFISGEWTNPEEMYFVFKSMAVPACSPSWIAFAKESEAESFAKGFGGKVYDFDDALEERVKHPKGMKMEMKM